MSLKAGHANDLTNSLTKAMEDAMEQEWKRMKGQGPQDPPFVASEDRLILFAGIARGLLGYLESHQNDTIKTMTMNFGLNDSTATIKAIDLDVVL